MALHELATNALKYGALSSQEGSVKIWWNCPDDGLAFHWVESGGPPVSVPTRRGIGSMLITQNLKSAFAGSVQLNYDPGGVKCHLNAPRSQLIELSA